MEGIVQTIMNMNNKKNINHMNTKINVRNFGLAFGIAGALLYLGCALVMVFAGREGTITFFNNLLHGLDVAPIIRMDIPWWEGLIGILEVFIISWVFGACVA